MLHMSATRIAIYKPNDLAFNLSYMGTQNLKTANRSAKADITRM